MCKRKSVTEKECNRETVLQRNMREKTINETQTRMRWHKNDGIK